MTFQTFSEHWAGPLSNVVMVLLAIILLYPVIWKLSISQMSAAFEALKTAKDLPIYLGHITEASERLQSLNREIGGLREKLGELDTIQEELEIANRRIADLQKLSEERPPEPVAAEPEEIDEARNWEAVSGIWFEVKDMVEERIGGIADGRIRRKYNSIPRYTYEEITPLLVRDNALTAAEAEVVNAMDRTFRSLRNRKTPVTPERVREFQGWRARVGG